MFGVELNSETVSGWAFGRQTVIMSVFCDELRGIEVSPGAEQRLIDLDLSVWIKMKVGPAVLLTFGVLSRGTWLITAKLSFSDSSMSALPSLWSGLHQALDYSPAYLCGLCVNTEYLCLSWSTKYFYLGEFKCKNSPKSEISFINCFPFLFICV